MAQARAGVYRRNERGVPGQPQGLVQECVLETGSSSSSTRTDLLKRTDPVLPILDNPSPRKGAFYRYNDYFTLLSHPIPDNLPPHQAATRISVWRFSWSASPTALEHEPSLRDLPAATFLLPANERDARLDAGRIANNSAANPVSGIVVACMPLSASYPVARSAPAVPTQVLGTQGKERKRDKCVVM